ncbi:crotonase/enoyl-CoA hydratase family protein [Parablastomonas sp. CN1-191]|uniref:crotonase/enoyl-CoA hydratase family protein n=1 Tax=Parablastomonas sp. CN1-191 TaxID=3400908 RepID=UPI003BF8C4F0
MGETRQFGAEGRVTLTMTGSGVAEVVLARGDKMNALDPAMFEALIAAGHALFDMSGLRCVVLSGEGRAFCAGLDMASMAALGGGEGAITDRTHGNANHFQQVALQWRKLPVPVIAAIHGVCFGGGLQIACGADVRVVHPEARLSVMEMKWGIVPDMAGYVLWKGTVRDDVLRELTYTNREFSGAEAQVLGFATLVDADPRARAAAIAADIAARNPHAIRAAKRLFGRYLGEDERAILMAESVEQHALVGSRNQVEAVRAQMERRAPDFAD